ncbi:MAG: hypothetical protein HKM07_07490 [Chlamydiae bacterium]|nr:hypothetical protein [Chlamydiota bacterium]
MRYKFYREHKYVSFLLHEVERLVAKTDFRTPSQVHRVQEEFTFLVNLLEGHADYENEALHELLKKKGSSIHVHSEEDHKLQHEQLQWLQNTLTKVKECTDEEEQIELGYQFYLHYRKFVSDNLAHLHEEETIILPELQRLYTDEELQATSFATYEIMTAQEMIHMMEGLFPHMNPSDKEAFLTDIKKSQPEKFIVAWEGIKDQFSPEERDYFENSLLLKSCEKV